MSRTSPSTHAGNRTAVLLTLASSVMFGTSGTAQALGPHADPIATAASRLLIGAAVLSVTLPLMGQSLRSLPRQMTHPRTWLGASFVCVFQFGYFYSAQRAGVALGATVTMGAIPLITGLVGVWTGHKVTAVWLVSTVVCGAGLVLLSVEGVHGGDAVGVVAAIVAAAAGAGFTLTVKRMIEMGDQPDVAQSALFLIAGSAMAATAAMTQPMAWLFSADGLALALWLGIVTMALPNQLWVRGLRGLSPGVTATLLLGEPLTATLLAVVVLHESLSATAWTGLAAVAAGLVALGTSTASSPPLVHE